MAVAAATQPKTEPQPKASVQAQSPYAESFEGRKWFFLGIKQGPEGRYPCAFVGVGPHMFQAITRRPIAISGEEDGGKGMEMALGNPEHGDFAMLDFQDVQAVLARARALGVRWRKGRRVVVQDMKNVKEQERILACEVIDYSCKSSTFDQATGRWVEGRPYNGAHPSDEPLAKYLVMLSREDIAAKGGRKNLKRLPSILDLDPSTAPPQIAKAGPVMEEIEPWGDEFPE